MTGYRQILTTKITRRVHRVTVREGATLAGSLRNLLASVPDAATIITINTNDDGETYIDFCEETKDENHKETPK